MRNFFHLVSLLVGFVSLASIAETYTPERVYQDIESHLYLKSTTIPVRAMTPSQICLALSGVTIPVLTAVSTAAPDGPFDVAIVAKSFPAISQACWHVDNLYQNSCINSIGRARDATEFVMTVRACASVRTAAKAECVENKAALARFTFNDLNECLKDK